MNRVAYQNAIKAIGRIATSAIKPNSPWLLPEPCPPVTGANVGTYVVEEVVEVVEVVVVVVVVVVAGLANTPKLLYRGLLGFKALE